MFAGTFVDILRNRAASQGGSTAYTFLLDGESDEESVTYGDLDRRVRAIAATLQAAASPGDRVLLACPPSIDYIAAFLGCLYAGVVAVPVFPIAQPGAVDPLGAIIRDCQPRFALTTSALSDVMTQRLPVHDDVPQLAVIATDTYESGREDAWVDRPVRPDEVAYLQYSSGSTGTPHGVLVTHGNLVHNSARIAEICGNRPDDRGVSWLPPYHDMGLIGGVLQPLYTGFHPVLMSPLDFLARPMRWLLGMSRIQGVISVAPNFAYELCVREARAREYPELDLSHWRAAFVGAEPIRAETLDRFSEVFAPYGFKRRAFISCYGLAESTLMVSAARRDAEPTVMTVDRGQLARGEVVTADGPSSARLVGCGAAIDDHRLEIVDPATRRRRAAGEVGEIWTSGPSVARGYWNRSDETTEVFEARLADTGDGPFLRTGDLGALVDGELVVTGRLKDVVIIHGRNYYPSDIEATVENAHPGLRRGCGAAFGVDVGGEERLVVVQEIKPSVGTDECPAVATAVRRAVGATHQLAVHAVVLVDRGGVPKTMTGKIRRPVCRAAFVEGTLRPRHLDEAPVSAASSDVTPPRDVTPPPDLAPLPDVTPLPDVAPLPGLAAPSDLAEADSIEEWLVHQIAAALSVPADQVDPQVLFADYGLDSVVVTRLSGDLTRVLGYEVSPVLLFEYPTITEIAGYLTAALPAAPIHATHE